MIYVGFVEVRVPYEGSEVSSLFSGANVQEFAQAVKINQPYMDINDYGVDFIVNYFEAFPDAKAGVIEVEDSYNTTLLHFMKV